MVNLLFYYTFVLLGYGSRIPSCCHDIKLLNTRLSLDSFAGITEVVLLESLSQLDTSSPVDFNGLLPIDLPRPPNAFRGIRKKTSSFKRWLTIYVQVTQ